MTRQLAPVPASYAVLDHLRASYDRNAMERDSYEKPAWKHAERSGFLNRLRAECKDRLLELGAGTGQDSLFFQQNGVRVVATDASHEMVKHCREKGVDACVMDFQSLDFDEPFDAAFAFNCLLHVPNVDLPGVLLAIHRTLRPDALFYAGVYGGDECEGVFAEDWHDPPRFFSFRSDATLLRMVQVCFDVVDFRIVTAEERFQALTLRKRGGTTP